MLSEPSDLLDENGLAEFFHRDISTIRRWRRSNKLPPCSKFGRRVYWRRQALLDHIAANESPSGESAPPRKRRS
jgi:hypothetical protein